MNQFLLAAKIWLRALLILSGAYVAGVATLAILTGNSFTGDLIGMAYVISLVGSAGAYVVFACSVSAIRKASSAGGAIMLTALLAAASAGLSGWAATVMVLGGHPLGQDTELLIFPAAAVAAAVFSAGTCRSAVRAFYHHSRQHMAAAPKNHASLTPDTF